MNILCIPLLVIIILTIIRADLNQKKLINLN